MTTTTMMTIEKYAAHSGLGLGTTRRLCHIGDFPALQSGRRWLIHRDEADRWLADAAKRPGTNLGAE